MSSSRSFRLQVAVWRRVTRVLAALRLRGPVLRLQEERARARRRRLEVVGSDALSRPALHEMDRKLDQIIDRDWGFFVEAGANDGYNQSNTYWLERFRGWRGVLIEPIPEQALRCRRERPTARVVEAALVPEATPGQTITMHFGDLMSTVEGAHGDAAEEAAWVGPGLVLGWRDPYTVEVPARTLSDVLDEAAVPEIDLLSLDVEGFEPQALAGLDLSRHAPRWIAVEAHDLEAGRRALEAVLGERYVLDRELSPLDLLFRRSDVPAPG